MSYAIVLKKTPEGIEVVSPTADNPAALASIPDGQFQISGHHYDGPGSAPDAISVREPGGQYASAYAAVPKTANGESESNQ